MFRHVLFPTDGSDISASAARTAVSLAKSLGARLTVLHVVRPYVEPAADMMGAYSYIMTADAYERATKAETATLLADVAQLASASGVPCETASVIHSAPWEAIIKTARERACDAIVMASHGRKGMVGLILGSETTKVLTHSSIPVLVTR